MQARLTLESGSAIPADSTLHEDQPVTLGRGLDNTIVLSDKCASKLHARIFAVGGRWMLRDLGSRNGVLVDGRRVRGEMEINSGMEIGFGEIRFRFTSDALSPPEGADGATAEAPAVVVREPIADDQTALLPDELTALYRFLSASLAEAEPYGLIRLALETLYRQTRADFVGYRGLDADDLLVVLPERERVETCLSSRMTRKALTNGAAVWLADPVDAAMSGESLAGVRDALCVPLRDARAAEAPEEPSLGALHAYRRQRPFTERELRFCEVLAGCLAGCLRGVRDRRALEADNSRLRLGSPGGDDALVGDSPAVRQLRDQVARLADHAGSILITGETGVGKELVALGLHRASRRRHGPLVTVNCASLNPSTAVAEFFGHAPGAYTGGEKAHPGFFQQADGGALFLDEVGELSPEMQAMLLRVLETRRFRPMKAVEDFSVDVRVLAATNRDLAREARAGRFRQDLFYRFTVSIHAPPLRDHAEDIPALARHFLAGLRCSGLRSAALTEAALERLRSYAWPGNVRQLRYVLEGAAALSRDGRIDAADLHLCEGGAESANEPPIKLEELEAWAIRRALQRAGGEKKRAAELLGIHRETLLAKIRKYGINGEQNSERPA
ncbi:MAG TPA: sigma 54-interacting transcriptional regulator [Gemmataceae bacterium]|nr:sigma 54-interacting transcriptional regulator [Gemmataceae bacterium]